MAKEKRHRSEVFGIGRELPLNYVVRPSVDNTLVENLTRDKHIVVYGSSKQGKTSLRKYHLEEENYVLVTCSNRWDLGQLHSAILKEAGYTIEQSTTKTASGKPKIRLRLGARLGVPGAGEVSGSVGTDRAAETTSMTSAPLELDPYDVNDVIRALHGVDRRDWIVLEDFHYLPVETQTDFSVALKAFHESSPFSFIVIGVWLDANRLIQYNGDLTGRVVAVNADKWLESELDEVISKGEDLLNIKFDPAFRSSLIKESYESVYIVQEACQSLCESAGINHTQDTLTELGSAADAGEVVADVVNQQTARYNTFLSNFSLGFQHSNLEMYKWILFPVLTSPTADLEKGLRLNAIKKAITAHHDRGSSLNTGNLTQALQYAASLQIKQQIKPIILDYDQSTTKLNVVDRGFLIWLEHQDREQILESIGLPKG